MPHQQRPLETGFTPATTAREVLRGIDLTGKNVIVTGGHGRLGLETTRALAEAGASVTVAARNMESAGRAIAGIPRAEVGQLDLAAPRSIDAFAARWLTSHRPLHILVNSATPPPPPELTLDARGYEIQLATSHLGHFQLTLALLPALRAAHGARVVNLSSGAQRFGVMRWDDLHFAKGGYGPHVAYAQAKMANVLFTVELDRRFAKEGIRAFAVHPGVIVDPQVPGTPRFDSLRAQGLLDEAGAPIIDPERGKKTAQQGASTIVLAAASPLLVGVGGVYLKDNDVSRLGATVYRLYAAPSYVDTRGQPRTVADLRRHDAVLYRGTAGRGAWELIGPRGPETVAVAGGLSGDSHQFVLDAVVSGHGIGLIPEQLVAHAVSTASNLVNVLPKLVSMGALQSLVSPSRHLPKRVTLVRDFLAEHLMGGCVRTAAKG